MIILDLIDIHMFIHFLIYLSSDCGSFLICGRFFSFVGGKII